MLALTNTTNKIIRHVAAEILDKMARLTWHRPSPEVRSRTLHLLLSVQTTASHPSRAAGHQSQCQPIHRTAKTTKKKKR